MSLSKATKREPVPSPSSPALEPGPDSACSVGTCSIPAVFQNESSCSHPVQMPSKASGIYVYAYMTHVLDQQVHHIFCSFQHKEENTTLTSVGP